MIVPGPPRVRSGEERMSSQMGPVPSGTAKRPPCGWHLGPSAENRSQISMMTKRIRPVVWIFFGCGSPMSARYSTRRGASAVFTAMI